MGLFISENLKNKMKPIGETKIYRVFCLWFFVLIFIFWGAAENAIAVDPNDPNTPPDPAFGNMPSQQGDTTLGEDRSTDPYYRPSKSSSSDDSSDSALTSYGRSRSSSSKSDADSDDTNSSSDQYIDTTKSKPLSSSSTSSSDDDSSSSPLSTYKSSSSNSNADSEDDKSLDDQPIDTIQSKTPDSNTTSSSTFDDPLDSPVSSNKSRNRGQATIIHFTKYDSIGKMPLCPGPSESIMKAPSTTSPPGGTSEGRSSWMTRTGGCF